MDIGPVQLIAFGFEKPKFGGGIAAELNRLKDKGLIRVLDAVVVRKTPSGEIQTLQASDLTLDQAEEFGAVLGSLVGLGAAGEEGITAGAQAGIETIRKRGGHVFDAYETWYPLEDMQPDSAAALLLVEHRWAIPFRDAVLAEGGVALGDLWVHPADLVAVGLISKEIADKIA
jgi:uncharacterized membrane protein